MCGKNNCNTETVFQVAFRGQLLTLLFLLLTLPCHLPHATIGKRLTKTGSVKKFLSWYLSFFYQVTLTKGRRLSTFSQGLSAHPPCCSIILYSFLLRAPSLAQSSCTFQLSAILTTDELSSESMRAIVTDKGRG